MKTKLNIWIFLGILCIFFSLNAVSNWLSVHIITTNLKVDLYLGFHRKLMIYSSLTFVISFFLTPLLIKNKKYAAVGFSLLYALSFPILLPGILNGSGIILCAVHVFIMVFRYSCHAIILYLGFDWINKLRRTQELEKKNLQSELSMLKNQINPHFLFNTLNNIDSLIKKNPDYASKSIIELSDIMRYMIYETNVEKVPLKKELEYIDNYLALQKLQYFNDDLVEYTIAGDPKNVEVAPMLFIPFIENAFKHCTNKETKHAIRFSFLLDAEKICFEAMNIADKKHVISKDKSSGIGLDTIKRRLEILYPQRYSLQIQEKNDLFCISLMIKIND